MSDYWVSVCAACLRSGCALGERRCPRCDGQTMTLASSVCRYLDKEPRDNYSRERIKNMTGKEPEEIRL